MARKKRKLPNEVERIARAIKRSGSANKSESIALATSVVNKRKKKKKK